MNPPPLMPKATAIWLIDNTSLTFDQIADFCGLHVLEVQGLADEELTPGMQGLNPIMTGQLTKEEIERCEKDEKAKLTLDAKAAAATTKTKGPRYTPLNKRQNKPDGIAWLIKHYPTLGDSQIIKLIGTTRKTIEAIRTRSHQNMQTIRARDPVLLGLCSQQDLNDSVAHLEKKEDPTEEQN